MTQDTQRIPSMEEAQDKAKTAASKTQDRVQDAGARAQHQASHIVRQNEHRLESAFGLLSLVLAVLGSTVLFAPDKAALLAFGPGVFRPSEQSASVIEQCVSKARHGKVPEAATKAYVWITNPEYPLPLAYEVDLRIIGSAILGASLVAYLLKRAAADGTLNQRPYKRLVMALFTWAALSSGISLMYRDLWNARSLMVWLAFLANTALITAPLALAQNPVSTLKDTAEEARHVRTGRGKLFCALAAFFFVEGLGILAYPTLAQRALSGPTVDMRDPVVGLLFSLVAASAHIIVPAAVFNLKSLSDQGNLANLTSFINNAVLFIVAATHVINLTRSALAGDAGPIAPVLMTAWTTAFVASLSHFPYTVEGRAW